MGAMNRHPSCTLTWRQTTLASQRVSDATSNLMRANSLLETVLLAEFNGCQNAEAADQMIAALAVSVDDFTSAQALIRLSIDTAQANPDDFVEARAKLDPEAVAATWSDAFLPGRAEAIERIATEIKGDRLATARRFVVEMEEIIQLYPPVISAFQEARVRANAGTLRESLEANKIPVQRTFGELLSRMLQFMSEYLIDSLVATQVSFDQRQRPALVIDKAA